jgi:ATP-dependent RNA helicase HelY
MAVNLVGRLGAEAAGELLEQSFGQFQADRSVVGLAKRIERNAETLAGYAASMQCHLGDFTEYAALRRRLSDREKALSRQGVADSRDAAAGSLRRLKAGDVIAVPGGRRAGLAVVLDPGIGGDADPRPLVLTEDRWAGRLSAADFPVPVEALGRMRLPRNVDHRVPRTRRDLASALRDTGIIAPTPGRRRGNGAAAHGGHGAEDPELATLRRALRAHPCHGCADREAHARWAERYTRLERENEQIRQKVRATTHSLARAFDRIRALLGERDYLDGETVTPNGTRLARLWGESDLLTAECLRHGVWDGLEPAELASVVSALVYEARRDIGPVPRVPSGAVAEALAKTVGIWSELEADERRHHVERTREPDLGFAWPMHRWARGESLAAVLTAAEQNGSELSAGDFVRWCRQVVDLLDQIADVSGRGEGVGRAAAGAVSAIRRGVVAVGTA